MKKILILMSLFTLSIIFGCCKDDPVPQTIDDLKTSSDFNGEWEFVNLYVEGDGNYTECNDHYKDFLLSISIKNSKATITNICSGKVLDSNMNVTYTPYDKILELKGNEQVLTWGFYVFSYNNGVLVLSWHFMDPYDHNGVYCRLTFQRK